MKRSMFSVVAVWHIFYNRHSHTSGFAETNGQYQQAPKDTIPKKIIPKVKIAVKDLMDGSRLDRCLCKRRPEKRIY